MLLYAKKWLIWRFLKIYLLSNYVTKLILQTSENLPENTNKEAFYRTAIQMKYSSKILKRRIVSKKIIFFKNCNALFGGVTKLEAFQWCFVTKLYPPKPSPLCGKLKLNFHFW